MQTVVFLLVLIQNQLKISSAILASCKCNIMFYVVVEKNTFNHAGYVKKQLFSYIVYIYNNSRYNNEQLMPKYTNNVDTIQNQ